MRIVTAAQMQALDRRTIAEAKVHGLTLMARAGAGVVETIEQQWPPVRGTRIAVVCGKGNNGGDGWVVARLLRAKGARIRAFAIDPTETFSPDAHAMHRRFLRAAGAHAVRSCPTHDHLAAELRDQDLIVDAVLGTGLASSVRGPSRHAIEAINEAAAPRRIPVVAVDVPSGVHADTGAVMGAAVRATHTVTFGLPKLGLYLGAGLEHAGRVHVVDIGIPPAYIEAISTPYSLITAADVADVLPPRRPSSHKGTYGHAAIIAGSPGKTGAAAMAAVAALRTGVGLVTVATPAGAHPALESKLLEAMSVPMPDTEAHTLSLHALNPLVEFVAGRSASAIGPGLTTHPDTVRLVQRLLPRMETPTVVDADALNALVGQTALFKECKTMPILTPHPGEMARLVGTTAQTVNADRATVAARFAAAHRVVVVLKGAGTVVAHPDGRVAICPTGNPGMATAGTGDVLTGMIVGLIAQRIPVWDAGRAAVYLHGLAGDLAAEQIGPIGLVAGDLLGRIPAAIRAATERPRSP